MSTREELIEKTFDESDYAAIESVKDEIRHQICKWGRQKHSLPVWITILGEEFGELCQAAFEGGNTMKEAVQCAAVSASIVAHLIRGESSQEPSHD